MAASCCGRALIDVVAATEEDWNTEYLDAIFQGGACGGPLQGGQRGVGLAVPHMRWQPVVNQAQPTERRFQRAGCAQGVTAHGFGR